MKIKQYLDMQQYIVGYQSDQLCLLNSEAWHLQKQFFFMQSCVHYKGTSSHAVSYGQLHQLVTQFYISNWPFVCIALQSLICFCTFKASALTSQGPLLQSCDYSLLHTCLVCSSSQCTTLMFKSISLCVYIYITFSTSY